MTDRLDAVAGRLALLWGWRRLLAAFVLGALSALAMAPFDALPVLFLTFPCLVWLLDGTVVAGRRPRLRALVPAALTGWAFGFGYFLAGLWWIGQAFLVEAETFAWLIPFAMLLLPAGLALFTAAGTALARLFWSTGPARIFAFAFGIGLAEYARGQLLTGFPWNGFGYVFGASVYTMQGAALLGTYGLAALAALVFAAPAALAGAGGRATRIAVPAAAALTLAALFAFGAARLGAPDAEAGDAVRLRIVQPAIAQENKWAPERKSEILATYLELTDRAASPDMMGAGDADLVIWPESAIPFVFDFETVALPAIAAVLPPGTSLVTGLQRVEQDGSQANGFRVYNSVFLIDDAGAVAGIYDKVKLVPFGEFLPWQRTLESLGLEQLTRVVGGFAAGERRAPLAGAGAPPFLPLVCYEIIFPGELLPEGAARPRWLLNVTNDAWFGDTPGPWQHLRQARLRAVEEGLPVVRAANTGVSAIIDARGRVVGQLRIGARGVLDGTLPPAGPPTFYARHGEAGFLVLLAACLVVAGAPLMVRGARQSPRREEGEGLPSSRFGV